MSDSKLSSPIQAVEVSKLNIRSLNAETRLHHIEAIIDAANIGVFEWPDSSAEEVYLSEAFFQSLGYGKGILPSTRTAIEGIVHPEDVKIVKQNFRLGLKALVHRKYEARLRSANGEFRWYEINLKGYLRPEDDRAAIIATVVDAHARTQLRLDNELLIERMNLVLQAANAGIFDWQDTSKEPILIDASLSRLLSIDPVSEGNIQKLFSRVHPEDYVEFDAKLTEALKFSAPVFDEAVRIRTEDRGYRYMRILGKLSPEPNAIRFTGAMLDQHESITNSEERDQGLQRLNLVLEGARAGVYDWPNQTESYIDISASMCQLLGYNIEDVEHDVAFLWGLIHQDDHEKTQLALDRAWVCEDGNFDVTYRIFHKYKGYRYARSIGKATPLAEPGIFRLTGAIYDVHEATTNTIALANVSEQMEQFSYLVAHDILAPLRQLASFTDILLEDYADGLDDQGLQHLSTMKHTAESGQQFVHDLLAYSKIGTQALQLQPLDLNAILRDLIQLLDLKGAIQWELDDFPTLNGDRSQISTLFQNLLANAVKFSTATEKAAHIQVRLVDTSELDVEICVADNGIGFLPDFAEHIFSPFERAPSSQGFEGSGIGLANVARIVSRHHGSIRAEGIAGEGAKFYVRLPSLLPN